MQSDRLGQSPVKTDRNIEVRNFRIHGAKVEIYFGFKRQIYKTRISQIRKTDFHEFMQQNFY